MPGARILKLADVAEGCMGLSQLTTQRHGAINVGPDSVEELCRGLKRQGKACDARTQRRRPETTAEHCQADEALLGHRHRLDGQLDAPLTIPDDLGGLHGVAVRAGDQTLARVFFAIETSIVSISPTTDLDGRDRYVDWYYAYKIDEPYEGGENYGGPPYWGKYAFQGHYIGFRIINIAAPGNPKLVGEAFCDGDQKHVRKLIAGPKVFICDACVEVCNQILPSTASLPGALCSLCHLPIVPAEAIAVPDRGLVCQPCASAVQAATLAATDATEQE